eukprot:3548882-Prymnesium_polylepis.2
MEQRDYKRDPVTHMVPHGAGMTVSPDVGINTALNLLREQCLARGFEVVASLGLDSERGPTATEILVLMGRLENMDFSEYDALLIVIAAHGRLGAIRGYAEPNATCRWIDLRDDIFRRFQLSQQADVDGPPVPPINTVAARTLAGKPKLFVIDAQRGDGVGMHVVLPRMQDEVPMSDYCFCFSAKHFEPAVRIAHIKHVTRVARTAQCARASQRLATRPMITTSGCMYVRWSRHLTCTVVSSCPVLYGQRLVFSYAARRDAARSPPEHLRRAVPRRQHRDAAAPNG